MIPRSVTTAAIKSKGIRSSRGFQVVFAPYVFSRRSISSSSEQSHFDFLLSLAPPDAWPPKSEWANNVGGPSYNANGTPGRPARSAPGLTWLPGGVKGCLKRGGYY